MPAGRWRKWMAAIVLVALVARMGAVLVLKRWDSATPGVNRQLALSLIETGSFSFREYGYFGPSSIATPAYPILLAAQFRLFGSESPTAYFAALTINAVLGAITAAVIAKLVQRLSGQSIPAVAAGLLVALWPPQIFAATYAQPMVLGSLCIAAACLLWARAMARHDLTSWTACSLALALAALIEPALLPAIPVVAVVSLLNKTWPLDLRVRNVSVLLLASVLLLLPWIVRNHAVHDRWVMTTTLWQRVWSGANENATGSDRLPLSADRLAAARAALDPGETGEGFVHVPMLQVDQLAAAQRSALHDLPEIDREGLFATWAADSIKSHPGRWLGTLPLRVLKLWWIDYDHPMSRNPLAIASRTLLALAAIAGGAVTVRSCQAVGLTLIIFVVMVATAAATIATSKQTVLIEPLQIAVACAGVAAMMPLREGHRAVT